MASGPATSSRTGSAPTRALPRSSSSCPRGFRTFRLAGSRSSTHDAANAAVELTVRTPAIVRNGEILETVIDVRPRRRIAKLVIGVEEGLWRGVTVNSTVPTAAEESFHSGLFRFGFAAAEPGQSFVLKIDQQVIPGLGGRNRGRVVVFDDKDPLAELALELTVLP